MNVQLDLSPEALETLAQRVAQILDSERAPAVEPWLTVDDAARHLGCKAQRVYDLVSRRRSTGFPCHRDGSRRLFKASELDQWVRSQAEGGH